MSDRLVNRSDDNEEGDRKFKEANRSTDDMTELTNANTLSSSELAKSLQDLQKKHAALDEKFSDVERKLRKESKRTKRLEGRSICQERSSSSSLLMV